MFTNGKAKLEPGSFLLVMVFLLESTIIAFVFQENLLTPALMALMPATHQERLAGKITIVVIFWP